MRTAGADGRPYALDYGAVMAFGTALHADVRLLASVLPAVETIIIDAICGDDPPPEE